MLVRVLLVIESAALRKRLRAMLSQFDVLVSLAPRRGPDWDRPAHETTDLIVADERRLPPPPTSAIARLRQLPDRPEVVVLSQGRDPAQRAALLAAGALAVLDEELPDAALQTVLGALIARRHEWQNGRAGVEPADRPALLSDFVSASPGMQAFLQVARRVVDSDSSLLILGETGVGKERLARAVHSEGPRRAGPFIAVNCGALPEPLLESELFGHEEGAFTGATRARRGYFELAHRGTIFLDEIGEMPPHLQVRLLRVLQEHEIRRVGSERPIPIDVRLMTATNRDLEAEVAAGRFRRDLYYRMAVVVLTVPPLRERRLDIPDLAASYIIHFSTRLGRPVTGLSAEALAALINYDWPGNVRELINVIERAVLLCAGDEITPADLPYTITAARHLADLTSVHAPAAQDWLPLPDDLMDAAWPAARRAFQEAFERAYLARLLRATGGRIGETAARAGIAPRSLFAKMKRLQLRKEDFKTPPR